MKDINNIMPKIPDMKWGALMNKSLASMGAEAPAEN